MRPAIQGVVVRLNRLIEIEYDALESCSAAADGLADGEADDRRRLNVFIADHRRHADELASIVRNLGGEPASVRDLRRVLGRGRARDADLGPEAIVTLNGVRAVIESLRDMEQRAARAYNLSASQLGIPVDVLALIERNGRDERAHVDWIESRLGLAL
jgi:hypothetical protein